VSQSPWGGRGKKSDQLPHQREPKKPLSASRKGEKGTHLKLGGGKVLYYDQVGKKVKGGKPTFYPKGSSPMPKRGKRFKTQKKENNQTEEGKKKVSRAEKNQSRQGAEPRGVPCPYDLYKKRGRA